MFAEFNQNLCKNIFSLTVKLPAVHIFAVQIYRLFVLFWYKVKCFNKAQNFSPCKEDRMKARYGKASKKCKRVINKNI